MQIVWIQTAIWANRLRTLYLIFLFPAFLLGIFWLFFGIRTGNWQEWWTETIQTFYIIWPIILVWALLSFFLHRQIIFSFSWAEPISRISNPDIYNIVENLCISRWLPVPKIAILNDKSLNAFAVGWNPKNSWIVFSKWIIEKLNKKEIEAVAAHELTHIMNKDSMLMIIIVVFIWAVAWLGEIMFRSWLRLRSSNNSKWTAQIKLFLIMVWLLLLILWYLIFPLVQLAISRKREFLADAGSAQLTKNPQALISALLKISQDPIIEDIDKPSIAAMCIANPLSSSFFKNLFSTHPSIEDRIKMLKKYW